MTSPAALLTELAARGVEFQANGDKLRFRPIEKMTPEEVEAIRQYKPVILKLLRSEAREAAPLGCGPHNDPAGWMYSPDRYQRPAWRTVHCRLCGGFIGYQPQQGQRQ
jgi:hypothetical protein